MGNQKVSCGLRVPVDVVKQRLQVCRYNHLSEGIRHIVQTDGLRGFYRGFGATLFRDIPFSCIQFPLYEWLNRQSGATTPLQRALVGCFSGSVAALVTTPLDVVKTRVMLNESTTSALHLFRETCREEGWRWLGKGAASRATMIGLGGLVYFGTYEAVKSWL